MKFLGVVAFSLCVLDILHGRPVNYNLYCECSDSDQIRLIQTISLGEELSETREMSFSPVITVAIDPVKCSQKKVDIFTLKYGKEKLGDLIFGSQICTLDPVLKCDSKDYDVYLAQEGGSRDFKLYIEKKAKSAPNSPIASLREASTREVHSDSDI